MSEFLEGIDLGKKNAQQQRNIMKHLESSNES